MGLIPSDFLDVDKLFPTKIPEHHQLTNPNQLNNTVHEHNHTRLCDE